ncbi:MAG: type IV pilus assembly protein PilM [Pseudomonadota bacterium]
MSLFTKKHSLAGIDISESSIKLVELSQGVSRGQPVYRLEHYGVVPVPDGSISGTKVSDPAALANAMKSLLATSRCKAKRVAVAVPGNAVISKKLSLPADMSAREMGALVQLEADQFVPYSLDDVRIDYEVRGPSSISTENVDVVLAASRIDHVDDRVNAVAAAGLDAVIVDSESFALDNACMELGDGAKWVEGQGAYAIADIGKNSTSVMVVSDGEVVYTREQSIGAGRLNEDIQHRYGLDVEAAEKARKDGSLPADYSDSIVQPFMNVLGQEIRSALQFYRAVESAEDVSRLFLTGGGACIQGIRESLEQSLRIPTRVFSPLTALSTAPDVHMNQLKIMGPSLAVACGLALRRFDS